jgi:hypothetical protein
MELKDLDTGRKLDVPDLFFALVDENGDRGYERREPGYDLGRFFRSDVARALLVEIEPERVGAAFRCEERVVQIGDTADFYFNHDLLVSPNVKIQISN